MQQGNTKYNTLQQLQKEILSLQGFKQVSYDQMPVVGLGPVEKAFPFQRFPVGAIHEFLSSCREDAAATNGFVSAVLGKLMQDKGTCLWITTKRTVFPPALKLFGIQPHNIIFIDPTSEKQTLWAVEEALKCASITAVVGELGEVNLTESRRLQLAVEHSRVTGFIHRHNPRSKNAIASIARWKITPIHSQSEDGMPGVGFPRWHVQLSKVRNGKPGTWEIEYAAGKFNFIETQASQVLNNELRKIV